MTRSSSSTAASLSLLFCLLFTGAPVALAQVDCSQPLANASGSIVVHSNHIFCGEINSQGRAVGFHSRPEGKDPVTIVSTGRPYTNRKTPRGVYELPDIEIRVGNSSDTKDLSTMFPNDCRMEDVITAIQNAANGKPNGRFKGSSGSSSCQAGEPKGPFQITGIIGGGEVETAWPYYEKK